jgi:hypothetical protein
MSNIPLVQPDVLDSMIRSPALAFFESQKGIDATALLGTYEYPMDFHLRDSESALPESVYCLSATGEPFRALLLGEIHSMDCLKGETEKASPQTKLATRHLPCRT